MIERARQPSPLIDQDTLLKLPALEDAGMLGFEAMAFVRLFVPNAEYALYVSGADGRDTLFGLLNTAQTQQLGFFYLSEYEWARQVLGIPIQRDMGFTQGELRKIAYRHYSTFLKDLPGP